MALGLGLQLEPEDVEMTVEENLPTIRAAATNMLPLPKNAPATESNQRPIATTFLRQMSLDLSNHRHHFSPSAAPGSTQNTASHPTSLYQTTDTQRAPSETAATSHTYTNTADMTISTLLPTKALAPEFGENGLNVAARMFPPPVRLRGGGSLHKRRVSASPNKFNNSHFQPLTIRTDLPISNHEPPAKRTRTANKIEICYDSVGTPQIRGSSTPVTAREEASSIVFSPAIRPDTSITISSTSKLFAQHLRVASKFMITRTPRLHKKQRIFSLLDAIVNDNSLCIQFVSYLSIPSLIDLYAISKLFHYYVNKFATAYILSSMRTWAPNADMIFPWRCYPSLCIKDPIRRQKATVRGADISALGEMSRDVPSIRWLQMVTWREGVVKDMCVQLAKRALVVPPGTRDAIKRMWFALDLPLNSHRLALIRNGEYISDHTLRLATHFFLKVDMHLTDPGLELYPLNHLDQHRFPNEWAHGGAVGCTLRATLLAERSFTPLWRVICGWSDDPAAKHRTIEVNDILKLWTRHNAVVDDDAYGENDETTFMGIEIEDRPVAGYERLDMERTDGKLNYIQRAALTRAKGLDPYEPRRLLRSDELVMREAFRRGLPQHEWWTEMMLWGFTNEPTLKEKQLLATME